jgi:ribosomal peptide maturation radical SAM protein 1
VRSNASDVVICVPPFALADQPSLGASILVAGCKGAGLTASIDYASIRLRDYLDEDVYFLISRAAEYPFLGELLFAPYAFLGFKSCDTAINKLIERNPSISCTCQDSSGFTKSIEHDSTLLNHLKGVIPAFLSETCDKILSLNPKVVGLSSTFQQTNAALAIAQAIRLRKPDIVIAIGGANFDYPMGAAWRPHLPYIDTIFSGECDESFPVFCSKVCNDGRAAYEHWPSIIQSEPLADLNKSPVPDFMDFIDANATSKFPSEHLRLFFESSRGCWWGEKQHCTFCGLNSNGMTARYKSPERMSSELQYIIQRHKPARMHAADNILPLPKKLDMLKIIAEDGAGPEYFYEVKANISPEDLITMRRVGITGVQPGIESLSKKTLLEMRKGTTGFKNIHLLRSAVEAGVYIAWNYLFGFPGETESDFFPVLKVLPYIEHLPAPEAFGAIRVDRYSPYLGKLHPFPQYCDIFPFTEEHSGIAYHFLFDDPKGLCSNVDALNGFEESISAWQKSWNTSRAKLYIVPISSDSYLLEDTRSIALDRFSIVRQEVIDQLRQFRKPRSRSEGFVGIDEFIRKGWIIDYEDHLLSVVLE